MKKTYFIHQSNSFQDYKIIKMRSKLGIESYGIFWALLELLFNEENKLCIDDYDALAFSLQCDSNILKQVIEDFDLFVVQDGCFYSKRLNEHIEEINTKSNKAKESASRRWNNANAMRTHSEPNASISISSSKSNSKSINKRIEDFKKSIHAIEDISDDDKNDFFLYWTEKNKSGSKFRAEMQKTFDINLRLKRWASNGFSKQKSSYLDYWDEYTYKKLDSTRKKEYTDYLKSLGWESIYSPTAGTTWRKKYKA